MAMMTQRVSTIPIEQIPGVMQEFVVGIPPIQIRLMRRVARAGLVYIEVEEAATTEEDDDDDAGDAGDQSQIYRNLMDCDPNFLYIYTVVTGSQDQNSTYLWTYFYIYIYIYFLVIYMC